MGERSVGKGAPQRCLRGVHSGAGGFPGRRTDRQWSGDTGLCVSGEEDTRCPVVAVRQFWKGEEKNGGVL